MRNIGNQFCAEAFTFHTILDRNGNRISNVIEAVADLLGCTVQTGGIHMRVDVSRRNLLRSTADRVKFEHIHTKEQSCCKCRQKP